MKAEAGVVRSSELIHEKEVISGRVVSLGQREFPVAVNGKRLLKHCFNFTSHKFRWSYGPGYLKPMNSSTQNHNVLKV